LRFAREAGKDRTRTNKEPTMKDTLRPGMSRTSRITIDRDRTISFMGEEARVYSTSRMVHDVEMTCRNLLVEHCDPGEDSVGVGIALTHLAATLMGSTVEIAVRVTAVDKRKVEFQVSAKDEIDQITTGNHTRVVVGLDRRIERLQSKAAKLAALKA
jgi:fluoroacetyl-CoA thioesterase